MEATKPTLAPSVALPCVPFMFASASKSPLPECQPSARLTITLAGSRRGPKALLDPRAQVGIPVFRAIERVGSAVAGDRTHTVPLAPGREVDPGRAGAARATAASSPQRV